MSLATFLAPSKANAVFFIILLVVSAVLVITWFGTGCNNLNVLGSHSRAGDQCKVVTVGLLVLAWPFPIAVIILDGLRLGITVTTTLAALPVLPWYWLLACTMDWLRRKIPEN